MRHIFVTHKHVDHLMGIIWMVRMICQFMNHGEYQGEACIYSHREVLDLIRDIAGKLLLPKETRFIDDRLHLIEVRYGANAMYEIVLELNELALKHEVNRANSRLVGKSP